MRVKVTHCFRDQEEDLKFRKVGEVFDATEERAVELKRKGFVEEIKERKKTSESIQAAE